MSNTDAGSTVERQKLPARSFTDESLRFELESVLAPEVLAPVHDVDGVVDRLAGRNEDGGCAVGTAATGEGGGFLGLTTISRDNSPETEDFVEGVLEVLAGFKGGKGDIRRVVVSAKCLDDGLAELGEDFWVAKELVEGPGEEGCGCVAAGEQDVQELGAEFDGVAGLLCKGFEEDVFLLLALTFFYFLLGGTFLQGEVHVVLDEVVDHLVVDLVFWWTVNPMEVDETELMCHDELCVVEMLGEADFVALLVC